MFQNNNLYKRILRKYKSEFYYKNITVIPNIYDEKYINILMTDIFCADDEITPNDINF